MLTTLTVLSLACKCVFYRAENNAKGGQHGIEFESSPMLNRNITLKRQKWTIICIFC